MLHSTEGVHLALFFRRVQLVIVWVFIVWFSRLFVHRIVGDIGQEIMTRVVRRFCRELLEMALVLLTGELFFASGALEVYGF
jgi:hypothetical protein